MEAVKSAKDRFKKYPLLIAQCEETAKQYALCVLEKKTLRKNDCEAEFARFKACLVKAAANKNTRL